MQKVEMKKKCLKSVGYTGIRELKRKRARGCSGTYKRNGTGLNDRLGLTRDGRRKAGKSGFSGKSLMTTYGRAERLRPACRNGFALSRSAADDAAASAAKDFFRGSEAERRRGREKVAIEISSWTIKLSVFARGYIFRMASCMAERISRNTRDNIFFYSLEFRSSVMNSFFCCCG